MTQPHLGQHEQRASGISGQMQLPACYQQASRMKIRCQPSREHLAASACHTQALPLPDRLLQRADEQIMPVVCCILSMPSMACILADHQAGADHSQHSMTMVYVLTYLHDRFICKCPTGKVLEEDIDIGHMNEQVLLKDRT